MKKSLLLVLALSGSAFLIGCNYFRTPYANFTVGKVDETSEQVAAAILVGDPQVISRETLINDRIRELNHLSVLIKDSKNAQFVPQLRRDLSVIRSLALELGIAFNPSAGAAFARNEDIESLRSDIELVKLRNELNQLQGLIESDPDNIALNPTNKAPGVPKGVTEPSLVSIQQKLTKAINSATARLTALEEASGTKTARESQISASPEEGFEDLNAYRTRLRQRESEVRLDDVHDANGNTLYRLQFNATVLPGEIKNKYGVLDFEILQPRVTDAKIQSLYELWLNNLMMRSISPNEWERMQSVLLKQGLFKRVVLSEVPTRSEGKMELILFTYPGDDETIIEILEQDRISDSLINATKNNLQKFNRMNSQNQASLQEFAERVNSSRNSLRGIEVFFSTMKQLNDNLITVPTKDQFDEWEAKFSAVLLATQDIIEDAEEDVRTKVPVAFIDRFTDMQEFWAGEAYSYQAQPTERVQRISSLASAANSLQMAMSLAATLPAQGVGIQAGAGAARTAVGMVDALERSPIVIGYTNRDTSTSISSITTPHFGYVFGPKAILNAKSNTLEYRQIPASHAIYADISVPSWWPSLTLKVRRAWAGNWHEGKKVLAANTDNTEFEVRLLPQRYNIDLLTRYLANDDLMLGSLEKPKIESVTPEEVSTCSGRVEFLIEGKHLWRNARAYLRGKRHDSLDVLPDMNGIVVSFDIQSLPKLPEAEEKATLVVWTSFGQAEKDIKLIDKVNGEPCGGTNPATAVFPSTSMTRYIDTSGSHQTVKVNLDAALPPAVRDIYVSAKLVNKSGGQIVESELKPSTVHPGKFYESAVPVDPPEELAKSALAEISLFLGLSYKTEDFGPRHRKYANRTVVYYPDQESANFKLDTTTIDDLDNEVTIILPWRFNEAYPKFVKHADDFEVKIDSHPKVPVITVADWNSVPGKVVLTLSRGTVAQADLDAFNTAWCTKDLTLKLEITQKVGDDHPKGIEGTLVLKKRTSGCS